MSAIPCHTSEIPAPLLNHFSRSAPESIVYFPAFFCPVIILCAYTGTDRSPKTSQKELIIFPGDGCEPV